MKKRTGFISNSSSSSFVIVGIRLSLNDVLTKEVPEGAELWAHGWYGSDGDDFFEVDQEMLNALRASSNREVDLGFWAAFFTGDSEAEIERDKLPEKAIAYSCNRDNWSTDNVNDFIERYLES